MVHHTTTAKLRIGARTVIVHGVIPGITGTGAGRPASWVRWTITF